MRRLILVILGTVVIVAAGGAAFVYSQIRKLESEQITDDVHVLFGVGGNAGVLRTADGPIVVDTMTFALQGDLIRQRAEELAGGTVQAVINTHYHRDHTHGNPGFVAGTKVISTARTREHLLARDAEYWTGEVTALLPNDTFDDRHELVIGGKTVRSFHPGRGHTDGDLVVLFVEDRVVHLGDLLFHRHYPNIDLEAGGSVEQWADTLDRVLELDFDRVIPGHGAVTDRDGIRAFQRFLRQLWEVGQKAAAEGWSLQRTIRSGDLTLDAGFVPMYVPIVLDLDREFVIRRVFEEATGAVP